MGGKGVVPSPPSSSPLCCMCGDHGLPQELFRCKVCLSRSQHKYCSDLYPKAETYRACNWCLREEGGKSFPRESTVDNGGGGSGNNNNSSSTANGGSGLGVKLHRSSFSLPHVSKPIKKQRVPERSASDASDRVRSEELSPGLGRARQAFRGKVRRYKLLEEVSS